MPPNDNFSSATLLSGGSGSTTGTTTGASAQSGEPGHYNYNPGPAYPVARALVGPYHTVWYAWTCPAAGDYYFSTRDLSGSLATNYPSTLQAFTGPAVNSLTAVPRLLDQAVGDGHGADNGASLAFTAALGTVYYLQIDGRGPGATGNFKLSWGSYVPSRFCACASLLDGLLQCQASVSFAHLEGGSSNGAWLAQSFGTFGAVPGKYQVFFCGGWASSVSAGFAFGDAFIWYGYGMPPAQVTYAGGTLPVYSVPSSATQLIWQQGCVYADLAAFLAAANCLASAPFDHTGGPITMQMQFFYAGGDDRYGATYYLNWPDNWASTPIYVSNGQAGQGDIPNTPPWRTPQTAMETRIVNLAAAQTAANLLPGPAGGPISQWQDMGFPPTWKLIYYPLSAAVLATDQGFALTGSGTSWAIAFNLRNLSAVDWDNCTVALLNTGGVSGASSAITGLDLAPSATTSTGNFTFTAAPGLVTATIQVMRNGVVACTLAYPLYPVMALSFTAAGGGSGLNVFERTGCTPHTWVQKLRATTVWPPAGALPSSWGNTVTLVFSVPSGPATLANDNAANVCAPVSSLTNTAVNIGGYTDNVLAPSILVTGAIQSVPIQCTIIWGSLSLPTFTQTLSIPAT